MNEYEKLEAIHCAIQESLNGNNTDLEIALSLVEEIREKYFDINGNYYTDCEVSGILYKGMKI